MRWKLWTTGWRSTVRTIPRSAFWTDENVHEAVVPRVLAELAHLGESAVLEIPPGEDSKCPEMLAQLWMALLENGMDRQSLLISMGGGVVTDLGGFLADTYMRGIDHILFPTSLLGMVDASIGGKTAIDVGGYKNLAGSFAPSAGVFAWTPVLESLPVAEWRAGWAECIKHAFLQGGSLWASCQTVQTFTDLLPSFQNWLRPKWRWWRLILLNVQIPERRSIWGTPLDMLLSPHWRELRLMAIVWRPDFGWNPS